MNALELETKGTDIDSKLKKLDDLKTVVPESKNQELLTNLKNYCLPVEKQYNRGMALYVQGKYSDARKCFNDVWIAPITQSGTKGHAKLLLAVMDREGQGLDKPDYTSARQGFQDICTNNYASAEHKVGAQLLLAEMNMQGQGIDQPNYEAAYQGFHDVCNNKNAINEDKAAAQFRLAEMNALGQGIDQPNFTAARQSFQEICNSKYVTAEAKKRAQEFLTALDRIEGSNCINACNTNNVSAAIEESAQLEQPGNNLDDTVEKTPIYQPDMETISQKESKKNKTRVLPVKPKREAPIVPSTRSTVKERPILQRRNTEANLTVNTEPKEKQSLLTRRSSSSDLSSEKKKKSEGYKLTQTDVRKALKKKKSVSNLKPAAQDDDSECSISETSSGLNQRRDKDLRKIKELLNDSNLVQPCGIKLTASGVRRALRELGADGQNKISWNFEKDNNAKHDKIVAQQLGDQHNSLCIHLHGKWYENKDIINHFLNFIRLCDGEVDALMTAIETRKSQKRNSIKYEKLVLK